MYRSASSSVGFGRPMAFTGVIISNIRDVTDTRTHTFDRTTDVLYRVFGL